MMFKGRSKHILDAKGRLAIPARFKEVLTQRGDDCLVLTNYSECLLAFTLEDWQVIEQKFANMSFLDQSATKLMRYFISGAQECPLKQGRITIPPDLREVAELKKDVALVGRLKTFEIWDQEKWDVEFRDAQSRFPDDSQKLHENLPR